MASQFATLQVKGVNDKGAVKVTFEKMKEKDSRLALQENFCNFDDLEERVAATLIIYFNMRDKLKPEYKGFAPGAVPKDPKWRPSAADLQILKLIRRSNGAYFDRQSGEHLAQLTNSKQLWKIDLKPLTSI
jgi:hypothetical protein